MALRCLYVDDCSKTSSTIWMGVAVANRLRIPLGCLLRVGLELTQGLPSAWAQVLPIGLAPAGARADTSEQACFVNLSLLMSLGVGANPAHEIILHTFPAALQSRDEKDQVHFANLADLEVASSVTLVPHSSSRSTQQQHDAQVMSAQTPSDNETIPSAVLHTLSSDVSTSSLFPLLLHDAAVHVGAAIAVDWLNSPSEDTFTVHSVSNASETKTGDSDWRRVYKVAHTTKIIVLPKAPVDCLRTLRTSTEQELLQRFHASLPGFDAITDHLIPLIRTFFIDTRERLRVGDAVTGLLASLRLLLHGMSGTGKTSWVRSLVAVLGVPCVTLDTASLFQKYQQVGEDMIGRAFEQALEHDACIVFVDDLDALCPAQSATQEEPDDDQGDGDADAAPEWRLVTKLCSCLDRLQNRPAGSVLVLACTNRKSVIVPALTRSGRFDHTVEFLAPSPAARASMLSLMCADLPLDCSTGSREAFIAEVAAKTHGFLLSDLSLLVREAMLFALRGAGAQSDLKDEVSPPQNVRVMLGHFLRSAQAIRPANIADFTSKVESELFLDEKTENDWSAASADQLITTAFSSIAGLDTVVEELRTVVFGPLTRWQEFDRLGIRPPTGVVLHGAPGVGKTLLLRCVAAAAKRVGMSSLTIDATQLVSKVVGESEQAMRAVFQRARASAPAVVLIDQLDSIAARRGEDDDTAERSYGRLLSCLAVELDSLSNLSNNSVSGSSCVSVSVNSETVSWLENKLSGSVEERAAETREANGPPPFVMVVGTTGDVRGLDTSVTRSGRLSYHIHVPLPDQQQRLQILKLLLRSTPLSADVSLEDIASDTQGASGALLDNLCREASLGALHECIRGGEDVDMATVRSDHLRTAIKSQLWQPTKPAIGVKQK